MPSSTVTLTVRSENGRNLATSTPMAFVIDEFRSPIVANQNPYGVAIDTEAGDTANQLSAWAFNSGSSGTFYWGLFLDVNGDRAIGIYLDSGHSSLVAYGTRTGDGVLYFSARNDYNVSGQVTVAYSVDDVDGANTINISNFPAVNDLQLLGSSEFVYRTRQNEMVKYTVNETVSHIDTLINGAYSFLEARIALTTAQIEALYTTPIAVVAAPGAGYIIEVLSGVDVYDYDGDAYTANTTADIVNTTTTANILATATNAFAGTSDIITRFIKVAGVVANGEGISVMMKTGNPSSTAPTAGVATIVVTYKITAI